MTTPRQRLSELIKELGSQMAVAEYLGVSSAYISLIIHDDKEISEGMARKLGFKKVRTITYEPLEGQPA